MITLVALFLLLQERPQPAPSPAPADVVEAVVEWSRCRSDQVSPRIESADAAEAIVDEAMAACTHKERQLAEAGIRYYGEGWRSQVAELRMRHRNDLVRSVNNYRTGAPPISPAQAWGRCIGEGAHNAPANETPEEIADRTMRACEGLAAAVLADAAASIGKRAAAKNLDIQRAALRDELVYRVRTSRTSHR